jgi:hypothetical protein
VRPYLKKKRKKRKTSRGYSSVIKHVLSLLEVLGSLLSTKKKKVIIIKIKTDTQEAEARGTQFQSRSGLHRETLSKEKIKIILGHRKRVNS